jgi:Na+/H+ antiporter NhaD/arsenite permease-like protein
MLIGQTGNLGFAAFFYWCCPPSILALFAGYLIIVWVYRGKMFEQKKEMALREPSLQPFDRWQTSKGIFAVLMLIALFFTPIPREFSAIGIAGVLLLSRKMKTRDIMGLVDWHLITLFCALFVIIHGVSQSGYLAVMMTRLAGMGMNLRDLPVLAGVSAILSNLFSNVPATMLLVGFLDRPEPAQWYTLAVSGTFAGNFVLLGSIANLIVVEQAAVFKIKISFFQHLVVGIPVTLVSLLILFGWIAMA